MNILSWILLSGLLMCVIALAGSATLLFTEIELRAVMLPLVALAAGTLLGSALFHLIPASVDQTGNNLSVYLWVMLGFATFFALEQFLSWRHCHDSLQAHPPLTYLILIADSLHNFIDGLAVAGAFLIDVKVGFSASIAAAAHEVPQELGDFAVLVYGGWKPKRALLFNVLSALTFLAGGLTAYAASRSFNLAFLLPFAAGNFIYIAAADLIPEVKLRTSLNRNILHFAMFTLGLALLLAVRLTLE